MKKFFTLIAMVCMALSANAQGKYALEAGQGAFAAGTKISTVPNITLTFGVAGEADFKDPKANSSVDGYTAFTEGNGVNGSADGGTQYVFAPNLNGTVTVAVVLNANKDFFVLEDGTALADYNAKRVDEKYYGTFDFKVQKGKTYKVYCTGSKLGFYGFSFEASNDPGDDPNQGGGNSDVSNVETYDAVPDGVLAKEFAAVIGDGGVATNAADGKSIITISTGKATVVAVGGTTPANDTSMGSGAQQITIGAAVEGLENRYEVASVAAWNDIKWEKKNQGDIDFNYVAGTGNPYVKMYAKQNSKDGELLEGNYSADYVFYEPDGSLGMPVTGLYYKFSATAKGAFKVKVWANKGNRLTFVVNAKDMKAQRLYASGYINGVNGANGQKRLLTVEQVDSVHNEYIYGAYNAAVAAGEKTEEELAQMKADADANAIARQYVIGNGGQNFWGWLTFDVEPGEEYWVFQHSSQIGFGGYEFYEGGSAEELIKNLEPPYVYTTNFSSYEDEETGERVGWKGEKIVGEGRFVQTDEEGAPFGYYYQNVTGSGPRQNYLLLPDDVFAHSASTKALTLAFWVSAEGFTPDQYTYAPLLGSYGAAPKADGTNNDNWPVFVVQSRGPLQINNNGWCDFGGDLAVGGKVNIYNTNAWEAADATFNNGGNWLDDQKWHYYSLVLTEKNVKCYLDGEVKNEWNLDGTTDGQVLSGFFEHGADHKYNALGGNQAWGWGDADSPFKYAKLLIKNSAMTADQLKQQMTADFPEWANQGNGGETPDAIISVDAAVRPASVSTFNLSGQKVDASYRGIVVKNGKKTIVR